MTAVWRNVRTCVLSQLVVAEEAGSEGIGSGGDADDAEATGAANAFLNTQFLWNEYQHCATGEMQKIRETCLRSTTAMPLRL